MNVLFAAKMLEDRFFPPLGICYLSAVLKKHAHSTQLVDAVKVDAVLDDIARFQPRILGISSNSSRIGFFFQLAAEVKKRFPSIFIVLGGSHAIAQPDVIDNPLLDAVCTDEGEESFPELIDRLEQGERYWTTPGFYVRHEGQIYRNPNRPPVQNLDDLPFPDVHLADRYPYSREARFGIFLASRGCPYTCSYCLCPTQASFRGSTTPGVRHRSAESVIEEIALRKAEYDLKYVYFMDNIFGIDEDRLEAMMDGYRRRIGLPFWCFVHPSTANERRLNLLKQGGCRTIEIGFESGDEGVRRKVLSRKYSNQMLLERVRFARSLGLAVQSTNILALPDLEIDEDLRTLDLNIQAKVDYPEAFIYRPFPGTSLANGNHEHAIPATITPSVHDPATKRTAVTRERLNLALLFPLLVKIPALRSWTCLLIKLPLSRLYLALNKSVYLVLKFRFHTRYYLGFNRRTAAIILRFLRA